MAKRFKFRLETVLKLRRLREEEKRRVVARRLREIVQADKERRGVCRQIEQQIDVLRQRAAGGAIDPRVIARDRHWLSRLNLHMLETQGAIRTLQAKLSMEQAELREASKQRKILEKIEERQLSRYLKKVEREEQKENDEAALLQFVRPSGMVFGQGRQVRG